VGTDERGREMKPHKPYGVWLLLFIMFVMLIIVGVIWWQIEVNEMNRSLNIWLDGGAVQEGLK
jgi:hypothetical protein